MQEQTQNADRYADLKFRCRRSRVGIVGALIAGWLLPKLGFVLIGGIGAVIINAVIGAVILLAAIGFVKKAA